MIGRFAKTGVLADVSRKNLATVVVAAALLIAAAVAKYIVHTPEAVVIGLSLGSLCLTGFPIIWGAVLGLLRLTTNVDELVSIAIIASMILGEWISAAVVAWIMVLGGLIEQYTSQRARRHLERLMASSPDCALLLADDGQVSQVPVDQLRPGQRILVRPGDVIAADGLVEEGESTVDESMLTGESIPVDRAAGDRVSAGTINGEGSLKIRVERVGRESTQGKIVQLVQQAEQHRAPILRAAETYARWFTPTVLALAAGVWAMTGDPHRAVTLLIVGCPCAFVLATPTAVIAALGRASKQGVLVKGGKFLEECAKVDVIAFDKTGTLTTGRCRIRDVIALDGITPEQVLAQAARLEAGAEHPLARAITAHAHSWGLDVSAAASIRREAGLGISEIAERPWHLGSQRFFERQNIPVPPEAHAKAEAFHQGGYSVLFLSEGDRLRGLLTVDDELRGEAADTLADLRKAGYDDIYMLTGDSKAVAQRVGENLGIPPHHILAELLPEQKYEHLEMLGRSGRHVCYVGDGTNDGPALARAAVGVSIASRENTVALETADVVLMQDGLTALPFLLRLGKVTTRTINQNLLLFGLFFNAAMLALSGFGVLTPIMGAIGHNIGSVAVVLNSARLLRFKDG
ncbi:MAG: heavy metal translocating P-type ATPase [Pirellulales bacterium]